MKKCAFLAILFIFGGVLGDPYVKPRVTKLSVHSLGKLVPSYVWNCCKCVTGLREEVYLSHVINDLTVIKELSSSFSPYIRYIMTGYDLLGARRVILSNVQTDSNLT